MFLSSRTFANTIQFSNASSLIDLLEFDLDHPEKSVKRLSIYNNTLAWPFYKIDGSPAKYLSGETNYSGALISGLEIMLPVGTRTIVLGRAKYPINGNIFCYYIVCFHEGKYREGFVNIEAFTNTSENSRVNTFEIDNQSGIIWKPFLDDSKRIIDYCRHITSSLQDVFKPFKDLIDDTEVKFQQVLTNNLASYASPQNFIDKLLELNTRIGSIENFSAGTGNLALNHEDKVDSLKRWLEFPPLKNVITNNISGGFQTSVIPISHQWFTDWKDSDEEFSQIFYNPTSYPTPNGVGSYKFSDILNALSGYGGTNLPPSEEIEHNLLKHVLKTLIVSFKVRTDNNPITQTPEAVWLKSLDENQIDNISNFIVIWSKTWGDLAGKYYYLSFVLTDHSIGYINSISGLSLLMHEINTWNTILLNHTNNSTYSGKALFFDTHGGKDFIVPEFQAIQTFLNNGKALDYFNNFPITDTQGAWRALVTNPHSSIMYLNHYLSIILTL